MLPPINWRCLYVARGLREIGKHQVSLRMSGKQRKEEECRLGASATPSHLFARISRAKRSFRDLFRQSSDGLAVAVAAKGQGISLSTWATAPGRTCDTSGPVAPQGRGPLSETGTPALVAWYPAP